MNAVHTVARAAGHAVPRQDHVRLPRRPADARGFKEWFHFCVSTPEVDAIVNFAVLDSAASDAEGPRWAPRLTVLAREDRWCGSVEAVDWSDCEVTPGQTACRLGRASFYWADGAYRVSAGGDSDAVEVHLVLEPETLPALVHNVDVGAGDPLHWLMVPRLRATGSVRVGDRQHRVWGAPAYHDHNWGRFRWSGRFAWEWGCALAPAGDADWAVVFTRMRDPREERTLRQGLFVWRGGHQVKVFRGDRMRAERTGRTTAGVSLRAPAVLGLITPEGQTDVPERFCIEAEDGEDRVTLVFVPEDTAQILVPHDGETGTTRIQEVAGTVEVTGRLGGEPVAFTTRTVVEFLRG